MIVIKQLDFSNMFSYGENNSIVLDANNVTQLVGNNGAGKSSIPTILEEILYNKNSRGTKKADIKNRYLEASYYSGRVTFDVDGVEYVLDKVVKSSTTLKLTKNGVDISGHTPTQTYKKLENEILKLDFNTFSKLVYQSMNSSLDFLKATDGDRKKFLISLLSLDKYVNIHETLKEVNRDAKATKDELVGALKATEDKIKDHPSKLDPKKVPEIPEGPSQDLVDTIADLKARIKEAEKVQAQFHKWKTSKSKLDSAIKEKEAIQEVENPDLEEEKLRESQNSIKSSISSLATEVSSLKRNIQSLEKGVGNCTSCGQKLPNAEDNAVKIEEEKVSLGHKSNDLEELKGELSLVESDIQKITKYKNYINKLEAATTKVESCKSIVDSFDIPDTMTDPTTWDSELQKLENTKKRIEDERNKAQNDAKEAEIFNAKLDTKNELLEEYLQAKEDYSNELSKAEEELADIKILLDAFGPKGLVQYKIESNIKVFEGLINDYLVKLSNGNFNIRFKIEDSKLKIVVFQQGQEININSASSGEFNDINTATLLAVRKMMTAISKVSLNILFLDEVISVLDMTSRENLINILIEEKDLNSVVVSHGFEHPLAETINIVKEDNISCLQN